MIPTTLLSPKTVAGAATEHSNVTQIMPLHYQVCRATLLLHSWRGQLMDYI